MPATWNNLGRNVASALVLLLGSCLPDPRPYDLCTDDTAYYAVPPVGCNGHKLAVLDSVALPLDRSAADLFDIEGNRITTDNDFVYWVGPSSEILQTPKRGGKSVRLLEPLDGVNALELQTDDSTLYVLATWLPSNANTGKASLFAIDKTTKESLIVATFPTYSAPSLQIRGDKFYINPLTSTVQCLLEGSTDPTQTTANGIRCVTTYSPKAFAVTDTGVVYLAQTSGAQSLLGKASLYFESSVNDAPNPIGEAAATVQDFIVSGNYAYWVECGPPDTDPNGITTCSRYRSSLDGTQEEIIPNLGSAYSVVGDADRLYAISALKLGASGTRLYGWDAVGLSPVPLAASLEGAQLMTLDAQFVYTIYYDYYTQDSGTVVKLLRIKR